MSQKVAWKTSIFHILTLTNVIIHATHCLVRQTLGGVSSAAHQWAYGAARKREGSFIIKVQEGVLEFKLVMTVEQKSYQ